MSVSVHHAAAIGFAQSAGRYASGRPDYPTALDGWLRDTLGVRPDTRVLDLGAGTGKFTRSLAATGATVMAVEPVEAMRAQMQAGLPDVRIYAGTADAIPLADASLDVVVCAQAFHWFATPAALDEIHRVLRPGGRLGLVWNVREDSLDWVAEISRLINPLEGDTPRYRSGAWRTVFPHPGFGPLDLHTLAHCHHGPAEQVIIDRFLSVSFIAALPDAQREAVSEALRRLIATHPDLRERETIDFPYRTEAWHCVRTD
ncbi:class I SAM-dependent methyltransferase [Chitinimonas sp. BJYL2]|uniref:class I SAM-dependent methyltransferase n=1 Tax=Chitinimonas sp. BJYL2 TaxID=2976696 RepID=UPI0022B3DCFB|nr:class I SAM-dependent methyltransferase [Chitinimonas sp. BJYL2]